MAVGEKVTGMMLSAANTAVARLGATPVDRSKVAEPKKDDKPAGKFGAFSGKGKVN